MRLVMMYATGKQCSLSARPSASGFGVDSFWKG